MPEVGEVRIGREIGQKSTNKKVWSLCPDCGKGRWVTLLRGAPISLRCHPCHVGRYFGRGRPSIFTEQERYWLRMATGVRYRQNLKLECLQHYSGKVPQCAFCKEKDTDMLCIDHINGGGKKHNKQLQEQGTNIYQWLRNSNYPSGYQVLCANHNLKKSIQHERSKKWKDVPEYIMKKVFNGNNLPKSS